MHAINTPRDQHGTLRVATTLDLYKLFSNSLIAELQIFYNLTSACSEVFEIQFDR